MDTIAFCESQRPSSIAFCNEDGAPFPGCGALNFSIKSD
jgi:hypothetical protein